MSSRIPTRSSPVTSTPSKIAAFTSSVTPSTSSSTAASSASLSTQQPSVLTSPSTFPIQSPPASISALKHLLSLREQELHESYITLSRTKLQLKESEELRERERSEQQLTHKQLQQQIDNLKTENAQWQLLQQKTEASLAASESSNSTLQRDASRIKDVGALHTQLQDALLKATQALQVLRREKEEIAQQHEQLMREHERVKSRCSELESELSRTRKEKLSWHDREADLNERIQRLQTQVSDAQAKLQLSTSSNSMLQLQLSKRNQQQLSEEKQQLSLIDLSEKNHSLETNVAALVSSNNKLEQAVADAKRDIDVLEKEYGKLVTMYDVRGEKMRELEHSLNAYEREGARAEDKYKREAAENSRLKEINLMLEQENNKWQVRDTHWKIEREELEAKYNDIAQQTTSLTAQHASLQALYTQTQQSLTISQKEHEKCEMELHNKLSELASVRNDYAELKQCYVDLEDAHNKQHTTLIQTRHQLQLHEVSTTQKEKQIEQLKIQLAQNEDIIQANYQQAQDSNLQMKELYSQLSTLQSQIGNYTLRESEKQDMIERLQNEVKGNDKAMAFLRAQLDENMLTCVNLESELVHQNQEFKKREDGRMNREVELQSLQKRYVDLEGKWKKLNEDHSNLNEVYNQAKEEISELQVSLSNLNITLQHLQTQYDQSTITIANLKTDKKNRKIKYDERVAEINQLKIRLSELDVNISSLTAKLNNLQSAHSALEAQHGSAVASLHESQTLATNLQLKTVYLEGQVQMYELKLQESLKKDEDLSKKYQELSQSAHPTLQQKYALLDQENQHVLSRLAFEQQQVETLSKKNDIMNVKQDEANQELYHITQQLASRQQEIDSNKQLISSLQSELKQQQSFAGLWEQEWKGLARLVDEVNVNALNSSASGVSLINELNMSSTLSPKKSPQSSPYTRAFAAYPSASPMPFSSPARAFSASINNNVPNSAQFQAVNHALYQMKSNYQQNLKALEQQRTQCETLQVKHDQQLKEIKALTVELAEYKQRSLLLDNEIQTSKHQLNMEREKTSELKSSGTSFQQLVSQQSNQITSLESQLANVRDSLSKQEQLSHSFQLQIQDLTSSLKKVNEEYEKQLRVCANHGETIIQLQTDYSHLEKQYKTTDNNLQSLSKQNDIQTREYNALKDSHHVASIQLNEFTNKLKQQDVLLAELRADKDAAVKYGNEKNLKYEQEKIKFENLSSQFEKQENALVSLQSKHELVVARLHECDKQIAEKRLNDQKLERISMDFVEKESELKYLNLTHEQLQQQHSEFLATNKQLNESIQNYRLELQDKNTKLHNAQQELFNEQQKHQAVVTVNDQLSQQLNDRQQNIDELYAKVVNMQQVRNEERVELQEKRQKVEEFSLQIQELLTDNERLINQVQELSLKDTQIVQLQQVMNDMTRNLETVRLEKQEVFQQFQNLQTECNIWKDKHEELTHKCSRLEQAIVRHARRGDDMSKSLSPLREQHTLDPYVLLDQEKQRFHHLQDKQLAQEMEYKQLIGEFERLKKEKELQEEQNLQLLKSVHDLQLLVSDKESQSYQHTLKTQAHIDEYSDLQSKHQSLKEQNQQLQQAYDDLTKTQLATQEKVSKLQEELLNLQQVTVQDLKHESKEATLLSETYKQENKILTEKLQYLTTDYETLTYNSSTHKEKTRIELNDLQNRVLEFEEKYDLLNIKLKNSVKNYQDKHKDWELSQDLLTQTQHKLKLLEKELKSAQESNDQYHHENMQLTLQLKNLQKSVQQYEHEKSISTQSSQYQANQVKQVTSNMMNLQTEYDHIVENQKKLQAQIKQLNGELESKTEIADKLKLNESQLLSKLNYSTMELESLQREYDTLEASHKQLRAEYESIHSQKDEIEQSGTSILTKIRGENESLSAQLTAANQQAKVYSFDLQALKKEFDLLKQTGQKQQELLKTQNNEFLQLKKEYENLFDAHQKLTLQCKQYTFDRDNNHALAEQYKSQLEQTQEQLKNQQELAMKGSMDYETLQVSYQALVKKSQKLANVETDLNKSNEELHIMSLNYQQVQQELKLCQQSLQHVSEEKLALTKSYELKYKRLQLEKDDLQLVLDNQSQFKSVEQQALYQKTQERLQTCYSQIEALENEKRKLEKSLTNEQEQHQELKYKFEKLSNQISHNSLKESALSKQKAELEAEKNLADKDRIALTQQISSLKNTISQLENSIEIEKGKAQQAEQQYTQIVKSQQALNQKLADNAKQSASSQSQQYKELEQQYNQLLSDVSQLQQIRMKLEKESIKNEEEMKLLIQEKGQLEAYLTNQMQQKSDIEKRMQTLASSVEQVQRDNSDLTLKNQQLQLELSTSRSSYQALLDNYKGVGDQKPPASSVTATPLKSQVAASSQSTPVAKVSLAQLLSPPVASGVRPRPDVSPAPVHPLHHHRPPSPPSSLPPSIPNTPRIDLTPVDTDNVQFVIRPNLPIAHPEDTSIAIKQIHAPKPNVQIRKKSKK